MIENLSLGERYKTADQWVCNVTIANGNDARRHVCDRAKDYTGAGVEFAALSAVMLMRFSVAMACNSDSTFAASNTTLAGRALR